MLFSNLITPLIAVVSRKRVNIRPTRDCMLRILETGSLCADVLNVLVVSVWVAN
jgi:hypothetical protein